MREFVDELISLGILQRASREEVVTTTPLFVVPKPGQEGQWRVIADMLRGGQNAASANDPVFLNRPLYILEQMYAGAGQQWSTPVNSSTSSSPGRRIDHTWEFFTRSWGNIMCGLLFLWERPIPRLAQAGMAKPSSACCAIDYASTAIPRSSTAGGRASKN